MPIYQVFVRIENGPTRDHDIDLLGQFESDATDAEELRQIGLAKIKSENPGQNYAKIYWTEVGKFIS